MRDFYHGRTGRHGGIRGQLTLVPNEAVSSFSRVSATYLDQPRSDIDLLPHRALSRLQMEIIATRASSNNQCYFCTTAQASMLQATDSAAVDAELEDLVSGRAVRFDDVPGGHELVALTDAIHESDGALLEHARTAVAGVLGSEAVADAVCVAASFQGYNRIANATGLKFDGQPAASTASIRERLGLNSLTPG